MERTAVVTGAGSGIGRCITVRLEELGFLVVAADCDISGVPESAHVTPFECDLSCKEGVDSLFVFSEKALGSIGFFFANAGFPYYEKIRTSDWDHISRIFSVNTFSPIYSYERYIEHLSGREGTFAVTCSAMGRTAMPGFALYSATKFALDGFRDALMFEMPDNVRVTFAYPVSTDTGFFRHSSTRGMTKPFPVQTPEHVAGCIVSAALKGKRKACPSKLYSFASVLFTLIPPVRWAYRGYYAGKLDQRYR